MKMPLISLSMVPFKFTLRETLVAAEMARLAHCYLERIGDGEWQHVNEVIFPDYSLPAGVQDFIMLNRMRNGHHYDWGGSVKQSDLPAQIESRAVG